jgi:hypothetical protein
MMAQNIQLGFEMPEAASTFAAELAYGLQGPKRQRKKKTLKHRDTLLAGVAKKVSAAFNMHLGATKSRLSQDPPPECGAVIAAAAMFGHGVVVNNLRADAICRKSSLPIDLLEENYALKTWNLKPLPEQRNSLRPTPPDEYRADPYKVYGKQFEKAARRLGIGLPIYDDPQ